MRALVNDSIEVGPQNWTPQLLEKFRKLRGYDPKPWFPALTGIVVESRTRSDRFLFDFRQTIADLVASEHYGTIAKAAHAGGLKRPTLRSAFYTDPVITKPKKSAEAAIITAVADHPKIICQRDTVNRPIARGLRTISIMTTISGPARMPLTTAAQ